MQHNNIALTKIDDEPHQLEIGDWITNSRLVLVRDNSIDGTLTGNLMRTASGALALRFERADNGSFDTYEMPFAPGAYMEIRDGATLRDNRATKIKAGMHELISIIRICHRKDLRAANEQLWKDRAALLTIIAEFPHRVEPGVYLVQPPPVGSPRRSIELSDEEAHQFNHFLRECLTSEGRTTELDGELVKSVLARMYASIGKSAPRVVIVDSPLVAPIVTALSIALYNWQLHGERAVASRLGLLNSAWEKQIEDSSQVADRCWPTNPLIDWRLYERKSMLRSNLGVPGAPTKIDWQPYLEDLESVIERAVCEATATEMDLSKRVPSRRKPENLQNIWISDVQHDLVESCADRLSGGNERLNQLMFDITKRLSHAIGWRSSSDVNSWMAAKFFSADCLTKTSDWDTLRQQCHSYWLHDEFCIVTQHPQTVNLDDNGNLHCNDGPAVLWRDGFAQYFLWGRSVTQQIVEHPETLTIPRIVDESNVELRRLMIQRYGEGKFLIDSQADLIHEDECGALFRKEMRDDEPLQMVRVKNSTPEPDGSYKHYFLRVPPDITTARAGVAWTFGFSPDEYDPSIES